MTIEYITLGVYFAFLLVIGTLFARFNKNLSDFARGGGKVTWWMAGTSITMGGISAFTFTGNGSAAYEAGPTVLVIYLANITTFLVGALVLARWSRQTRAYTGPDIIRARFGTLVEQFAIYFSLPMAPVGASVVLYSLAVFVSATFGFPLDTTILVVGGIVVFYSVSGGSWAIMATDVVQGIVLYSMTIIVAVLAMIKVGGFEGFFSHWSQPEIAESFKFVKEPGQFPGDRFTLFWIFVIFFMQAKAGFTLNSLARYLSVKDGREATRAAWWAMALMTLGSLVWFIPPMVARFLYSAEVEAFGGNDPTTAAYSVIARDLLPNGMMGIMIAAMFSATMSSLDAGIAGFSSVMVRNVISRIREWKQLSELSDKTNLRLCRFISLIMGILVICAALFLESLKDFALFDAFLVIGSVIGLPMSMPMLAGLFFRRLPDWAYFFILGSAILPSVYTLLDERLWGGTWNVQERAALVLAGGFIAILISVALRQTASKNQQLREDEFFTRMKTPVDFENEVGGATDASQALLIGRIIVALGFLILFLLILPNPIGGRLVIVTMSGMLLLAGGLLIRASKREGVAALEKAEAAGAVPSLLPQRRKDDADTD